MVKYPCREVGLISFAIAGIENNIRLETVGDFMGLMIMLMKTKIVIGDGERGTDNIYKAETVNLLISQFLDANISDKEFNTNDIMYHLKRNNILDDILSGEKINYRYEKCAAGIHDTSNKELINILNILKEQKEVIELELQHSDISLNADSGISVKIPLII